MREHTRSSSAPNLATNAALTCIASLPGRLCWRRYLGDWLVQVVLKVVIHTLILRHTHTTLVLRRLPVESIVWTRLKDAALAWAGIGKTCDIGFWLMMYKLIIWKAELFFFNNHDCSVNHDQLERSTYMSDNTSSVTRITSSITTVHSIPEWFENSLSGFSWAIAPTQGCIEHQVLIT